MQSWFPFFLNYSFVRVSCKILEYSTGSRLAYTFFVLGSPSTFYMKDTVGTPFTLIRAFATIMYFAESVEQDQTARTCSLILLYTLRELVRRIGLTNPVQSH